MSAGLPQVVLIGLGWHARRIYFPWLERAHLDGRLCLCAVVDHVKGADAVRAYLAGHRLQPRLILCSAVGRSLPADVREALEGLWRAGELTAIVLSTPPEVHLPYLLWALERGVDVLVDKPLTAPNRPMKPAEIADLIDADLQTLMSSSADSLARLVVMAQRRMHPAYQRIHQILKRISASSGAPVSHVDVYHADGMWVMPWEWSREHHPYKYGTGKLLHSGYHFVDLAQWFLSINDDLPGASTSEAEMRCAALTRSPADTHGSLRRVQETFFAGASTEAAPPDLGSYGEHDLLLMGSLSRGGHVEALVNLQLLQSSFSRRHSPLAATDPYKGAGRVRHERVNIQLGPLANVQVHAYQSHEVGDSAQTLPYGPGHLQHFDVYVYRNVGLIGGPAVERLELGREASSLGHNEDARLRLLEAFVEGRQTGSELRDHIRSTRWIAQVYRAIQRARRVEGGFVAFAWAHPSRTTLKPNAAD